jgi:hypothetical protein
MFIHRPEDMAAGAIDRYGGRGAPLHGGRSRMATVSLFPLMDLSAMMARVAMRGAGVTMMVAVGFRGGGERDAGQGHGKAEDQT